MIGLIIRMAMLLAVPTAAHAGDTATLEILGFKADGSVFAFEEYGIQDGSGFPYANRFFIDTSDDSFLAGTPVRVRIDDEAAGLSAARDEARRQADAIVDSEELSAHRGYTAGLNPVTESSSDPHRMVVSPRAVFPPIDEPLEIRLEEIRFPSSASCEGLGENAGFRLLRVRPVEGGVTALLHEDTAIPSSRGCPTGYSIAGIQTYHPEQGAPVFAVLIAVRRVGFEGPDHRYLAVTGRF